ncbi:hypothetical protein AC792_10225 [Arthrobacter sp. RIT-PI-e]|uniref:AMIN-like domain-containing (lipo)protein n=1 Tax=Arthrobacter sp. RIT-PI-e TaxID=1681197 RepID=UPI000675D884|nr:hypothetical protein [Arthrobacter sp. RIT-PI-e]KNC18788.1 hypothetical protein AC792_10225 [Arthrobacter sp. RIT-PI-e]
MNRPRTTGTIPAALALTAGLGLAGAPPASAAYCGITWGSTPKTAPASSPAPVSDVRPGRHACFDRLVVDMSGPAPRYRVEYVPQFTGIGSGVPIPLRGAADLRIVLAAPAYDDDGHPTYSPADMRELVDVAGYFTFRQIATAGSFEGSTELGVGVRAQLPVRAFVLAGPGAGSRLVIDVAHSW